jgi:hypothetical protein
MEPKTVETIIILTIDLSENQIVIYTSDILTRRMKKNSDLFD